MVTPASRPLTRPRAARVAVSEIPLAARRAQLQPPPMQSSDADSEEPAVPSHFLCPISLEMMRDPVTGPTGITYDRGSVEAWLLDRGRATCPVTGLPLRVEELVPNHATRRVIQDWCVAHRALGVERVPTPRVPVTAADAAELLATVVASAARGDGTTCRKLAAMVRALAKESERNHRCLAAAGAVRVLSLSFSHLVVDQSTTLAALTASRDALEEILAALVVFFPLDAECRSSIASPASLNAIVSVLSTHGEVSARVGAVVVLRELASSSDVQCLDAMSTTSGMHNALVNLLEKPVSPQATKAALVTAYYLVTNNTAAASRFVELGMVRLLVELIVDADKGTTEKALAVLDSLLLTEHGRGEACEHALTVPVLVKKLQHVSDMATEFAVSALWRLCKNNSSGEGQCKAEEALQVGTFQKLLLLLQVGCMGVTKDRASELLRLLNGSRGSVECIETVDFKGLKRPF
jgi:hypothetical protein